MKAKKIKVNGKFIYKELDDQLVLNDLQFATRNFDQPFLLNEKEMEVGSLVETKIQGYTHEGFGIGFCDSRALIVPFTLEGERVRCQIVRNHPTYSFTKLVEFLEKDQSRNEDIKCQYYGRCLGCQYQHINYETQLKINQLYVKRAYYNQYKADFDKVDSFIKSCFPSDLKYSYRNKITPHFDKPKEGRELKIGFQRIMLDNNFGDKLIDIESCQVASETINKEYTNSRKKTIDEKQKYKNGATLILHDSYNEETGRKECITNYKDIVTTKITNYTFKYPAGSFFQVNESIIPHVIEYVMKTLKNNLGDDKLKYLIDAYCGAGLFSIGCNEAFEATIGIDVSDQSIKFAKKNAVLNNLENKCSFILGTAHAIFKDVDTNPEETVIIIDPPRKGCDLEFLTQLVNYGPKIIIYVSCNPYSQAADLHSLNEIKEHVNYSILEIVPFDFFPQTKHVECILSLIKT